MILRVLVFTVLVFVHPTSSSAELGSGNKRDPITLEPITYLQWRDRLAGYPPDIVVVDFWATWCSSCVERFPKMVDLYRRYHRQGVRFVSMLLEDRADTDAIARAKPFLIKNEARFENYYMDAKLLDSFEKLGLIGIPAVIIYDRQHRERFRLTGDNPNKQFDEDDVAEAIVELMNKPMSLFENNP